MIQSLNDITMLVIGYMVGLFIMFNMLFWLLAVGTNIIEIATRPEGSETNSSGIIAFGVIFSVVQVASYAVLAQVSWLAYTAAGATAVLETGNVQLHAGSIVFTALLAGSFAVATQAAWVTAVGFEQLFIRLSNAIVDGAGWLIRRAGYKGSTDMLIGAVGTVFVAVGLAVFSGVNLLSGLLLAAAGGMFVMARRSHEAARVAPAVPVVSFMNMDKESWER
ncbi:MAG: hypothetical protein KDD89_00740 [Anaerolineales bacterium]|nr:hypothetical protein [Anaerolineales bacterium]